MLQKIVKTVIAACHDKNDENFQPTFMVDKCDKQATALESLGVFIFTFCFWYKTKFYCSSFRIIFVKPTQMICFTHNCETKNEIRKPR